MKAHDEWIQQVLLVDPTILYTPRRTHAILISNTNHVLEVADETLKLIKISLKSKTSFCKYSVGFLHTKWLEKHIYFLYGKI